MPIERKMLMIIQHSPRVRARQTAEHFMKGFMRETHRKGVSVETRGTLSEGAKSALRERKELEALTTVSEQAGKSPAPADKLEEEIAKVAAGGQSDHLVSKAEMMGENRMGLLLSRDKYLGQVARFLRRFGASANKPAVISIYLRHSRNKGDELTEDGKTLAEEQGRRLARHLLKYVFPHESRLDRPGTTEKKIPHAIILTVSHGGGKAPGQLDWAFEGILGKQVKEFGGPVSHAEGLITVAYGDGRTEKLFLRQHGVTHLHAD